MTTQTTPPLEAWDVYHYRANKVVTRSLAEFCLVLDTALAVAIIALTATA